MKTQKHSIVQFNKNLIISSILRNLYMVEFYKYFLYILNGARRIEGWIIWL